MPVPDYQSLFLPVLRLISDGKDYSTAEIRGGIAADLKLTAEDLAQMLPSGKQAVFTNRVAWSVVYLSKAGALERIRRGTFKITDRGRELLRLELPKLTVKNLAVYPEFTAFHKGSQNRDRDNGPDKQDQAETPAEQLENAYTVLRKTLASDILDAVKKASPSFFEQLVIDLLVSMGYGGSVEGAGHVVGKVGDGGIDGIIKEDKLGLDALYVQAKRWTGSVGRPVVQAFAGSLDGARARRGVLITTSSFTPDALDYVQRIPKSIVLIDGEQLAELMIDHGIGVSVSKSYQIKRLDSDYFDEA